MKCNDGNTGNNDINDIVENFNSSACIERDCGDDSVVGIDDHNDGDTDGGIGEHDIESGNDSEHDDNNDRDNSDRDDNDPDDNDPDIGNDLDDGFDDFDKFDDFDDKLGDLDDEIGPFSYSNLT